MYADRPPARDWYDLVTEVTAVKGWSVADLGKRSGVARSTIYGWRDNLGKPQAKSVNAVADALGISRERALRLAGIIGSPQARAGISDRLRDAINSDAELTEAGKRNVIAAIEETLAIERGEAEASEPSATPEPRGRAS